MTVGEFALFDAGDSADPGDGAGGEQRGAVKPPVRGVHAFRSGPARHAAAVSGPLLREPAGMDCTGEEIEAAQALCRALADVDPHGEGVRTGRLFAEMGERFSREVLMRRLRALITAGAVATRGKHYDDALRLTASGAVGLLVTPLLTGAPGQRMLVELLSRAHARAGAPGASAADVRADLADLRRVLDTCGNQLRDVLESGDADELIAVGAEQDDSELQTRVHQLRELVASRFPELTEELATLRQPVLRYCREQIRLLQRCAAHADVDRMARLRVAEMTWVATRATVEQLAAVWDGVSLDAGPVWLDAASVTEAADELLWTPPEQAVPEPEPDEVAEQPVSVGERLRQLAGDLLGQHEERDLTSLLLSLPWPRPAVLVSQLQLLTAIDARFSVHAGGEPVRGSQDGNSPRASWVTPMVLRYTCQAGSHDE